ncbi:hypothetical protein GQR58_030086 [Nymphon striatum]|nr:hypothetical protein GQR58_030086 [Nymphon striatum]
MAETDRGAAAFTNRLYRLDPMLVESAPATVVDSDCALGDDQGIDDVHLAISIDVTDPRIGLGHTIAERASSLVGSVTNRQLGDEKSVDDVAGAVAADIATQVRVLHAAEVLEHASGLIREPVGRRVAIAVVGETVDGAARCGLEFAHLFVVDAGQCADAFADGSKDECVLIVVNGQLPVLVVRIEVALRGRGEERAVVELVGLQIDVPVAIDRGIGQVVGSVFADRDDQARFQVAQLNSIGELEVVSHAGNGPVGIRDDKSPTPQVQIVLEHDEFEPVAAVAGSKHQSLIDTAQQRGEIRIGFVEAFLLGEATAPAVAAAELVELVQGASVEVVAGPPVAVLFITQQVQAVEVAVAADPNVLALDGWEAQVVHHLPADLFTDQVMVGVAHVERELIGGVDEPRCLERPQVRASMPDQLASDKWKSRVGTEDTGLVGTAVAHQAWAIAVRGDRPRVCAVPDQLADRGLCGVDQLDELTAVAQSARVGRVGSNAVDTLKQRGIAGNDEWVLGIQGASGRETEVDGLAYAPIADIDRRSRNVHQLEELGVFAVVVVREVLADRLWVVVDLAEDHRRALGRGWVRDDQWHECRNQQQCKESADHLVRVRRNTVRGYG